MSRGEFQLRMGLTQKIDFWAPTPLLRPSREERFFDVVGRLRPGVTVEQAQAEMDTVALNLAETYPATNDGLGVRVVPLQEHVLGNRRNILLLLVVSSGMVLLIAIGNAAGFLLTQGLVRHKEILTRTALGASRLRIVKQFLTESLVVALPAAILAVLLTLSGTALLRPFLPDDIPLIERVSVDPKVLGFTLITTLFVMCLVSIIPALRVSRPDRLTITGLSGRGMSANRRYHRTVFALIAVEVSLTFMLLIASGLMLKSAARLLQVDPGFDSENLLTMSISLPANKFEWTHNVVFSRQVIDSIESLNEVQDAAVMQGVPMHPGSFWGRYEIAGEDSEALVRLRVVSPGYFDVMQVPILSGRDFDARDEEGEIGRAPQVLISQVFAERYWPGEDAVGKRIGRQTIIGVVGDVRYAGMDTEPTLDVYYPEGLYPQAVMTLLVRTRGDPMNLVAEIRNRISQLDDEAFVAEVQTMDTWISNSMASRRLSTMLLAVFSAVALLLALTGIYTVIAQSVAQRKLEIGIRVALGANRGHVTGTVFRNTISPALVGLVTGVLGALGLTTLFSSMLFGVTPGDFQTWAFVLALTLSVCLLAGYIPSRRARNIDPALTLRTE